MNEQIIAGMYCLDDTLKSAWRDLFQCAAHLSPELNVPDNISFDDSAEQTLDPASYVVHTCGYPLVTQFSGRLRPLCVAGFNVPGCEQGEYYSVFVVRQEDNSRSLAECATYRAALNITNSNSGMNVFRAAIAALPPELRLPRFFASVAITGSHFDSVKAVANGDADIASIDAISYDFICRFYPELCAGLRVLERSTSTMGLPFVTQVNAHKLSGEALTLALNQALKQSSESPQILNISRFRAVELQDYQRILDLEQFAIDQAYPELQ